MIIAGEDSGDARAAGLLRALQAQMPCVQAYGIGGNRLRAAGMEILVDARVMAVVGLFEVLAHFPVIYGALRQMRRTLRARRPDLLILIDYPDFNLRLAKTAAQLGIKVLYYISPQVWAWRQKRVHRIRRLVDHMAVVFPFEEPFYRQAGVPVTFVGHPLVDEVHAPLDTATARGAFGLETSDKVLGLFPGSRSSEIRRLLPLLLESAARMAQRDTRLRFILPVAAGLERADLQPFLDAHPALPLTLTDDRVYEVMSACDAIISASGTATLEIALLQVPLVVVYRIAPSSYAIMRRLVKVEHIALCNIVAGERIAAELIQQDATVENIVREITPLLNDPAANRQMRQRLATVREKLGGSGASEKVARIALKMLTRTSRQGG